MDRFQILVKALSDVLGPSSGIDSDDVDPQQLIDLMNAYTSNQAEWEPYCFSDPGKGYTRNLVDEGNGKSNLLILVWQPGTHTPIHDHANAHCVMKILKGSLRETLYSYPSPSTQPSSSSTIPSPSPSPNPTQQQVSSSHAPSIVRETTYHLNQTTYVSDAIGLHAISNPSATHPAVSLHLYTPPHAANFGFNVFEPTTGSKSHVTGYPCFSKYGKKMRGGDTAAMAAVGDREGGSSARL